MVNVSAEEPMRFALLTGSPIAMIDPHNTEEEISKMTNNMFGHGKGMQKKLRSLAQKIKNITSSSSLAKTAIVGCHEFRDDFNP